MARRAIEKSAKPPSPIETAREEHHVATFWSRKFVLPDAVKAATEAQRQLETIVSLRNLRRTLRSWLR